jgi:hypothetical protein
MIKMMDNKYKLIVPLMYKIKYLTISILEILLLIAVNKLLKKKKKKKKIFEI